MFNTGLGVYIPIVLYVCFVGTCLWTLSANPRVGVYLLAVIVPLQRVRMRIVEYPLGANLIMILVLCVFVGAMLRGMRPRLGILAAPLIAMLAYLYVSLWWGSLYSGGELPLWLDSPRLYIFKDFVTMLMLCVVGSQVLRTRQDIVRLLGCFFISLIIVDRSALLEFVTRDMSHFVEGKRASGPFGSVGVNELAAYLSQFALFTFAFAFQAKLRTALRWLLYIAAAVTSLTLMYTFSRGAYIAFLSGLLVFSLLRARKMLVLLLLALVFWQFVVPTAVQERISMTRDASDRLDNSAEQRMVMWKEAVDKFTSSPLLGSGYGMFNSSVRDNGLRDTHNYYLKVLADTGLIGFALVLWLVVAMWRTAWSSFRNGDAVTSGIGLGLLLALSSLVIANVFGDRWTYIEINGLLWMLLAAASVAGTTSEVTVNETFPQDDLQPVPSI